MKELKTYRELFQAILDGYEVEYWNEESGEWLLSTSAWNFNSIYLDKNIVSNNKYRIKPTKPSIDWSHVSDEFNYLSRDKEGLVYLYENKPEIVDGDWWTVNYGAFAVVNAFKSLDVGSCHWTESLVERTKE